METRNANEVNQVDAVVKTPNILEALWRTEGAGVTALTEDTGLPKSTVYVHLTTLRSKGYVVKNGDEYRLSLRFLSFGERVKRAEPLHAAGESPISDLTDRTGERVLCLPQQNGLGTVIGVSDGDRSLSLSTDIDVGTHAYLHCSAGGKAMLAHFSEDRIDQVIADWGLPAFTDRTITDRDTLVRELESIRDEGIVYNHEEYLPGIGAVGAPVLDNDGTVYGAITITGPAYRLENEWEHDDLRNQLLSVTNTIEVNIMYA